jgi:Fe-S-cluster-containing hydrogenase component 2/CRP-like cAMP-binding protein
VSDNSAIRPQRWDKPFGASEMPEAYVDAILAHPVFADVDPEAFPDSLPLRGIIANDARYRRFSRGDILFRRGDYGNSLFILIEGVVRGVGSESAEEALIRRQPLDRKSWFGSLAQLWTNSKTPEYRESVRYAPRSGGAGRRQIGALSDRVFVVSQDYVGRQRRHTNVQPDDEGMIRSTAYHGPDRRRSGSDMSVTRLADVDSVTNTYPTFALEAPAMFGEIAALSRSPRTATVFADSDVVAVELRWQGLRDIRRWSDRFRASIDELYRERGLLAHLRAAPIFAELDDDVLREIAAETLFETYGDFEWTQQFQRVRSREASTERMIEHEPLIAQEGHYIDGLLLVRWGFARVSREVDQGEITLQYLSSNDVFGLDDIRTARKGGSNRLTRSLRAIGYVDVLRVPTHLIEKYILPTLDDADQGVEALDIWNQREPLIDFLVDNRIINGTATMVINTDRCVNCDDCVRACASTHGGNPRFIRHGVSYLNLTVANACMHCVDPVCLIGCPTGAIHRNPETRNVVIDDATCIGCATCAQSCPYNNIRMVETRDASGAFIVDDDSVPIVKATKCDLCLGQLGGPACQRACPHDALMRIDIRDTATLTRWIEE